jgi:NADH:ubiquinone oxidoreductase subunit B-like Fe-S oxidoreductase
MTNLLNYLTQARLVKAKFETGCCHVRLGSLQLSQLELHFQSSLRRNLELCYNSIS